jgi:competence protein ComEA
MWAHGVLDRATPGSVISFAAAVVAALAAVIMVVHHHSASGYSPSYEASASATSGGPSSTSSYADPTTTPDPSTSTAASIVVDVGGRVRKPGLVTLPAGARVADAISAAGGPLRHRELATTNLAARVSDGQLLLVGTKAAATAPDGSDPVDDGSGTPSTTAPVALNSATLEQLETLPNIGPVTGQKILDWRTAHGGFTSVEQLQQVSGIGPATYADLSPLVTL